VARVDARVDDRDADAGAGQPAEIAVLVRALPQQAGAGRLRRHHQVADDDVVVGQGADRRVTGDRRKLRDPAGDERAHREALLDPDAVLADEPVDLGLRQLDQGLLGLGRAFTDIGGQSARELGLVLGRCERRGRKRKSRKADNTHQSAAEGGATSLHGHREAFSGPHPQKCGPTTTSVNASTVPVAVLSTLWANARMGSAEGGGTHSFAYKNRESITNP